MSDLAAFVAATLCDKVVLELQEENNIVWKKLEEQRYKSQLVSITGPLGNPIYTEASFCDGDFDYDPRLWKAEFGTATADNHPPSSTTTNTTMCTLTELYDMEVQVGGMCKAQFGNGS